MVLRRTRAGHAHRGRRSSNGSKKRSATCAPPCSTGSSIAARRPDWRDAATKVEWLETIDGGPGYRIRKLRYEALPGLWIPAVLYEPENLTGKVPVILNVNGHTPQGKVYPPKQIRCINQAKRGMLALNVEWVGMGQLMGPGFDHYHMNQLDLCGTSGLAPFYLNMKRGIWTCS